MDGETPELLPMERAAVDVGATVARKVALTRYSPLSGNGSSGGWDRGRRVLRRPFGSRVGRGEVSGFRPDRPTGARVAWRSRPGYRWSESDSRLGKDPRGTRLFDGACPAGWIGRMGTSELDSASG
ncbi:hypothetical protein GCM10009565_75860 [Amycolatopsis albidoflavus]